MIFMLLKFVVVAGFLGNNLNNSINIIVLVMTRIVLNISYLNNLFNTELFSLIKSFISFSFDDLFGIFLSKIFLL